MADQTSPPLTPARHPQHQYVDTSNSQQQPDAHDVMPQQEPLSQSQQLVGTNDQLSVDQYNELRPPLPQRPQHGHTQIEVTSDQPPPEYPGIPTHTSPAQPSQQFQPPPQRHKQIFAEGDNPSNPAHFIRNPHKLIAYLVPFPLPNLSNVQPENIPSRFMIYTPPPPPLLKPAEGMKEAKLHKVQRKWQEEVRSAKTSSAKTASWKGVKSKATKGISWAMNKTTTSNLDFLGRVSPAHSDDDGESRQTHNPVEVDEMVLIYPATLQLDDQQMREEFVNTMLRAKSKAQRDTIIATGLMPVAYGIDILATLVWPFGGLGEIDTVWAYSSFRGAKTARSVTKRLSSSNQSGNNDEDRLKLTFNHSQRIEVLKRYLEAECHKADSRLFPTFAIGPGESDVLEAIGWTPQDRGGVYHEERNWEDESWQIAEVKDDMKDVFTKAAKEWRKWCLIFEKSPEKALKK